METKSEGRRFKLKKHVESERSLIIKMCSIVTWIWSSFEFSLYVQGTEVEGLRRSKRLWLERAKKLSGGWNLHDSEVVKKRAWSSPDSHALLNFLVWLWCDCNGILMRLNPSFREEDREIKSVAGADPGSWVIFWLRVSPGGSWVVLWVRVGDMCTCMYVRAGILGKVCWV